MDSDDAIYSLHEQESEVGALILQEWESAKGDPNARQSWDLIPAGTLLKEWEFNAHTGQAHLKIIEKIEYRIINNYLKLVVNTSLMGHTPARPFDYAESFIYNESLNAENFDSFLDGFEWFAFDDAQGVWRISDYAIEPMFDLIISLITEIDFNKKLYWIDQILSVSHQRSDLSAWFVEGGDVTLGALFEKESDYA